MEAKESKKAMSLGKKSIIGLIAGLIIGGICARGNHPR